MDIENMTADELKAYVQQHQSNRHSVSGLEFVVDEERCRSWKAFGIMRRVLDGTEVNRVSAMMELVTYCTDLTEADILTACGGETAPAEGVIRTLSAIVGECFPKK